MSLLHKKIAQRKVPPCAAGAPSASSSTTTFPPVASLDNAMRRQDTPVHLARSGDDLETTAAAFFDQLEYMPVREHRFAVYHSKIESAATVVVFIHGAGMCAMSWALVCRHLSHEGKCGLLAMDVRGHGLSDGDGDTQWDVDTLCDDVVEIVLGTLERHRVAPQIVLVGHSMGGALAARCAHKERLRDLVKGLVVLDVVEGTAMEALPAMRAVLEKRPEFFDSVDDAVLWSISSNTIHNRESALLSMPSQLSLKRMEDGSEKYVWRTNLFESEQYWPGWFTGLSKMFLSARVPKQLVLAGTDRLDTELMIGQMQGKFQVVLLPACGHAVQEDAPEQVAQALLGFLRYNNL